MSNKGKGQEFIERYLAGTASEEEQRFVERFYLEQFKASPFPKTVKEADKLKSLMWNDIATVAEIEQATKPQVRVFPLWKKIAGIAAAVIGVALCVWFFSAPNTLRHPELVSGSHDIKPGGNNATLTIGNGKPMQLSQAQNTVVVGNDLRYNDGSAVASAHTPLPRNDAEGAIPNITANTKRGGMYSIILPDNTKAWLNNTSELEFPAKFGKNEPRIVKTKGEVYFEVAKVFSPAAKNGRRSERVPFIVETGGQRIEVLGTHFCVSNYEGEPIKTTLLEGSVRVVSLAPTGRGAGGGEGVTLKPNQQSLVTDNAAIKVQDVVAEDAIAWKKGYFMFNNESLEKVMDRIARWYNVTIIYEDNDVKTGTVFGTISRFENVSKVLRMLERADKVWFIIEGTTIKVKKKK